MVLSLGNDPWKKQGLAVTRDSSSRMAGLKPNTCKVYMLSQVFMGMYLLCVKVLTLNVFLNYYADFETGMKMFADWVALI